MGRDRSFLKKDIFGIILVGADLKFKMPEIQKPELWEPYAKYFSNGFVQLQDTSYYKIKKT